MEILKHYFNQCSAVAEVGDRLAKIDMGHIVLDGDPAPPNGAQPPLFGLCIIAKRLDGSRWHLVRM